MEDLKDIGKPTEFWEYFNQITKIPRCSGHEDQMREFVKNEAMKWGFHVNIDQAKNIVVRIPSTKKEIEDNLRVVLQSHMDMVCEKNENVEHDFLSDPLKVKVIEIENEKWVTADGTTLGADNGVGMAYQLSIMKKIHDGTLDLGDRDLDLLFTVDEERGLTGASHIGKDLIKGKYLINLDSEEDDRFTVGCAGGRVFTVKIKNKIETINNYKENLVPVKLSVSGLVGGHSGVDIHKKRGNALKIISQILWKLNQKIDIHLNSINGGNLSNAIPRESNAIFFAKDENLNLIESLIKELIPKIKKLYNGIELNLKINVEVLKDFPSNSILSNDIQVKLLNILYILPNGPISFHPTSKGLVHTSSNLASLYTDAEIISFQISQRSLAQYDKDVIYENFLTILSMSGLEFEINIDSEYPSWPPNFKSNLMEFSKKVYKELFNEDVIIQAIHAGLECAYLSHHFPEMDMISIGPLIKEGHSPDERVNVKSVEKIWYLLLTLLEKLR